MLELLARSSSALAGRQVEVFYEVPSGEGVPDLMLVSMDRDQIASREQNGFLVEPTSLAVVLLLSARPLSGPAALSAEDIAREVGVGRAYLARKVLPRLIDEGHIGMDGRNYMRERPFVSCARWIGTVEAKLRDWKKGLSQATRHGLGADARWLALPIARMRVPVAHADWFRLYGVGLVSVDQDGAITEQIASQKSAPNALRRELMVERAAQMSTEGRRSGPVPLVFGNSLVASRGFDPRLEGALAR